MAWCVLALAVAFFDGNGQGTVVYLFFFALIAFLALALRFKDETRAGIALTSIVVVFTLYVAEVYLFYHLSQTAPDAFIQIEQRAEMAAREGKTYDTRPKLQMIKDLRAEGVDAYPSSSPALFVATDGLAGADSTVPLFPFGGVANKPTVFCNEEGFWSTYESDEHGFNNPKGLYDRTPWAMALIGDSFTQGACVRAGEDVASQLRRLRDDEAPIVSLSAWGNGPLLELATLKEYARPFQPKAVLWLYYEHNDLAPRDIGLEMKSTLLTSYLDDRDYTQHLLDRQPEIDSILTAFIAERQETIEATAAQETNMEADDEQALSQTSVPGLIHFFHLRKVLRDVRRRRSVSGFFQPKAHAAFRDVLTEARDQVRAWDGQLYFVYLPTWKRYTAFVDQDNIYDRRQVLDMVKALGIPVIDFHETLSAQPDPQSFFPFRIHGHYTAEGYRLLAEQIDRALPEQVPAD